MLHNLLISLLMAFRDILRDFIISLYNLSSTTSSFIWVHSRYARIDLYSFIQDYKFDKISSRSILLSGCKASYSFSMILFTFSESFLLVILTQLFPN